MSSSDALPAQSEIEVTSAALSEMVTQALAEGRSEQISEEAVQRVLTAILKLYSVKLATGRFPPFADKEDLTPTEVAVCVAELLKAAELELFEIAMWQALGRP